jgi:phosphatidylethanolamine/phosphatidyl-N-methylethanolamine N-methyltransferase
MNSRVLKPGGEIVLISRVGAEAGLRRLLERWFAPLTHQLGWRLQFPWARFERWSERPHGMQLIERRPMPPFGHFSLVRFAKSARAPSRMRIAWRRTISTRIRPCWVRRSDFD